jgi:hypothetical protein
MAKELIEFIDCGSLSISFDATGKASVSLTILRNDNLMYKVENYTNRTWGQTLFDLITMSASAESLVGGDWTQWSVQMEGVGY